MHMIYNNEPDHHQLYVQTNRTISSFIIYIFTCPKKHFLHTMSLMLQLP
jgi:hypothetical protein